MKILITGAAGFVASHLIDYALEQGDEVVGTIRWNEDLSRLNPNIEVEYCELTDITSLIRAINKHRPDVISHLAAQSWVPYSFDNPIHTMNSNAVGTLNVLEAVRIIREIEDSQYAKTAKAEHIGVAYNRFDPLIHICSSSEFYGKVPKELQPITEQHPASPMNPYGVGKVAADLMSQLYEKYYDMRILITRMFTHTGPRRTMASAECYYAKLIAEAEKNIAPGAVVSVPLGNMKSIRTWRDVRDAVTDYYNLFKKERTGIYNISGDTQKSIQEVLDYLISKSTLNREDFKCSTDPKLLRKVDVDVQIAGKDKFMKDIGQSTKYTFEETMEDLLNFWRKRV